MLDRKPEVSRRFFLKLRRGPHQGSDLIGLGWGPKDSNIRAVSRTTDRYHIHFTAEGER